MKPPTSRLRYVIRMECTSRACPSMYSSLQGGFLFTTVASCLQWPGTQNGHWSASALFYASILFALIAIILGSQQLLVLSNIAPIDKLDRELRASEKRYLEEVVKRLCDPHRQGEPNNFGVAALQAPFTLLSLAVLAFLAGLCSVVFAPLATQLIWDDHARVRVKLLPFIHRTSTHGDRSL